MTDAADPVTTITANAASNIDFYRFSNIRDIAEPLDFDVSPRMTRDNSTEIIVNEKRKRATEVMRYQIVHLSCTVLEKE